MFWKKSVEELRAEAQRLDEQLVEARERDKTLTEVNKRKRELRELKNKDSVLGFIQGKLKKNLPALGERLQRAGRNIAKEMSKSEGKKKPKNTGSIW